MAELNDVLVAVTGASGPIYADRLLRFLTPRVPRVGLIVSPEAGEIAARELGWAVNLDTLQITGLPEEVRARLRLYRPDDFQAHYASGSAAADAMIIIPCTIGSLGYIAAGLNDNLVHRAAGVCLKERRPLVLVVRESPLSLVDLRNMVSLAEAGVCIMPASPSFYAGPQSVEQLVDFFAIRVLDQIGVRVDYPGRWGPG